MATVTLTDRDLRDRLRLIRSANVGSSAFRQLLARYGTAGRALDALPGLVRKGGYQGTALCSADEADDEIAAIEKLGAQLLQFDDDAYPPLLAEITGAPPILTVLGNAALLSAPGIGMVGARNASAAGIRFTRQLSGDLGAQGFVIVSGMARGIDTAAHQAALPTGTVAVMAGGVDVVYPAENQALYEAIAATGVIVCEMPLGTRPQARHFPRRNRLISGLSQGLVVVEAALKSGSLITANYAIEQGREVFAVPGSPLDPRCRGTNNLIREGAVLTEGAEDILSNLQSWRRRPVSATQPSLGLEQNPAEADDAARGSLMEKLGPTPMEVDELIRQSGLTPEVVLTILLELELAGRLDRHAGNKVSLA
ncbi:DNA-processing protein DprA [Emcibacter sp. SYSU 3D8]|uniref:DNA-processing protein DprA n=1 Tax=Emcibacter sp. SYSU 3D8 TaxID=3133969 RepID=UPI0031FEFE3D